MILTFGNTYDISDMICSGNYRPTIKLDARHNLSLWSNGTKNSIKQIETKGKRIIEQVFSYEEYLFEFIYNVNTLRQLANLKRFDYFTIETDYETITPDEKEIKISDFNGNNEQFRKATITFKINFINKKTGNTNNEFTVNTAPQALAPLSAYGVTTPIITGNPLIGEILTANYKYYDADGDLEGATTFQWWRSENSDKPRNIQVISGETSQTYTQTDDDLNHYLWCSITPVALTGVTPGITVDTPAFKSEVNNKPTVSSIEITTSFDGTSAEVAYTYNDVEWDLEGTSLFDWQLALDSLGADSFTFSINNPCIIGTKAYAFEYNLRWIRVGITPVALTGATPGNKVFSAWEQIIVNHVPVVSGITLESSGIPPFFQIGDTVTALYTYYDKETDLEGLTTFAWQYATDDKGNDLTTFDTTTVDNVVLPDSSPPAYSYVRVGITPVALTGATPGVIKYSEWQKMNV